MYILKKSFSELNVRRKSHFYIARVSNTAVFSEDAPIPIGFLCCDTQDIIDKQYPHVMLFQHIAVLSHAVHCMEYESKIHSWQEDAQV